jgi:1,4-dihydroxy-2-naphthoate octaprenyltransferase
MFRGPVLSKLKRFGCGLVGMLAIAFGLFHPQHAYSYSYRNWFGGLVFGPIAVVFGAIAVLAAIFNWRKIWDSPPVVQTRKKF